MIAWPTARRTDPAESHAAAASAQDLARQHQVLILGALMQGAAGVDRIAAITKLSPYQVSKRMSELERGGAAKVVPGITVQSDAGRAQRLWERI